MNKRELVKRYFDAWNRQEVAGLLELMHPGAAYYDAFWTETCVGRDLGQYLQDAMDAEPFWYEQIGELIKIESGVVFRYSAHHRIDAKISEPVLFGAEVLILRNKKILTVSDFYCDPQRVSLEEVAEIARSRHGVPTYAVSGMSAVKASQVAAGLSAKLEEDRIYLDPDISLSQLAESIGCSLDQLSVVIRRQFETNFEDVLDSHRIEYARRLLTDQPHEPGIETRAAAQSGFKSYKRFSDKFAELVGLTPTEYCRRQQQQDSADNKSHLH